MTIEDALKAMTALDRQQNSTDERAKLITELTELLLTNPEEFWQSYFRRLDAEQTNPCRQLAERLLHSGAVTLGDLRAALEQNGTKRPPQ